MSQNSLNVPRGRINFPHNGDKVLRSFRASGTIEYLPSGYYLYLAVEVENLIWPKERDFPIAEYSWSVMVYEGGAPPNGRFSLSLHLVNQEGHQLITKWFENGRQTGDYPGLWEIKGGLRLHKIDLQLEQ